MYVGENHVWHIDPNGAEPTAWNMSVEGRRASMVVSGIEASSIVVTMSTKGTPMSTALTRSGRMVTTAPIVRPPADRPSAQSLQHGEKPWFGS